MFVPQVIAVTHEGDEDDFSTTFRMISEWLDFEKDFLELPTFDEDQTRRVFLWLARFHAFFWDNPIVEHMKLSHLGGWWKKPLRPTVKWKNLVPTFNGLAEQFPIEFGTLVTEKNIDSFRKMAEIAECDGYQALLGPPKTIIHGDVKTCNFFLRRDQDDIIAIDFQWTGQASSGVADIIYFFYGGVTSFLPQKGQTESLDEFRTRFASLESRLMNLYFEAFVQQSGANFCREEFDKQYNLELLDYFTTAAPYLLRDLTPKIAAKNLWKYGYLTYEFDPRMTFFFFSRALEAFSSSLEVLDPFVDKLDASA